MRLPTPALQALLYCGLLLGCSSNPTPYKSAMDAAEEARRDERFDQERFHFSQAADLAKKPKDASEARYRAAQSWLREEKWVTGATELAAFADAYPASSRAARAWLDAGRAWERAEDSAQALKAFYRVVTEYPESGGADAAAGRIAAIESDSQGEPESKTWRKLLEANQSPSFDEALRYNLGRALESEGATRLAILVYEDVARRHPLPAASHSDEALLRAALLRRAEGDAEGALSTLELLTEQGGSAAIVGSYTRTSYVEALLLSGLILRDDLKRPGDASVAFIRLPRKHPHSRLVDDALWEQVKTLRSTDGNACAAMATLRKHDPESRFLRCEDLICGRRAKSAAVTDQCERWLGEPAKSDRDPDPN